MYASAKYLSKNIFQKKSENIFFVKNKFLFKSVN